MKNVYRIATSLDRSYLDVEVALQAKSGVGLRPLPLYTIFVWIVAIFGSFLAVSSTALPLQYLPLILKGVFMLACIAFAYVAMSRDGGNQTRVMAIRNMATYMFVKPSRILKTRSTDPATMLYRLVGIKEINKKTGMVTYLDGTVAYFYRVVGNASALLFDSDKDAVITRVDNFYRKLPDYIRCEIITIKEPQKVVTNKVRLKELYAGLRTQDKDLISIMQESYRNLDEYVGGEFKSIHQYMGLFAGSKEYVNKAHAILVNETQGSGLMFSAVEPLYDEDVIRLMHTIYAED